MTEKVYIANWISLELTARIYAILVCNKNKYGEKVSTNQGIHTRGTKGGFRAKVKGIPSEPRMVVRRNRKFSKEQGESIPKTSCD